MADIATNMNPKHNPVTTLLGGVFILISAAMYIVKYIIPAFVVLKQDIPYDWWIPIIPLVIGLVLVFMNDDYFAKIFNRADKIAGKKTDTN
jgi:UDP-N-acetylmuramyl pentapeptide phosphotransferase/UDP-N-acetylglucosamine-1-phosphate transferase